MLNGIKGVYFDFNVFSPQHSPLSSANKDTCLVSFVFLSKLGFHKIFLKFSGMPFQVTLLGYLKGKILFK